MPRRRALLDRHLVSPKLVDASAVREQKQVGVCGGVEKIGNQIFLLQARTTHSAPSPPLGAERIRRDRLYVPGPRHGDHELFVLDQVLHSRLAWVVGDPRAALVAESLPDLPELCAR